LKGHLCFPTPLPQNISQEWQNFNLKARIETSNGQSTRQNNHLVLLAVAARIRGLRIKQLISSKQEGSNQVLKAPISL